jgi:hypothetical protein
MRFEGCLNYLLLTHLNSHLYPLLKVFDVTLQTALRSVYLDLLQTVVYLPIKTFELQLFFKASVNDSC